MLTKTSNNFIRRFLLAMGAFAIAISLILTFCISHRINVFGIVASLGIGGIAIAFAAQKTLEQFLGGIVLTLDRPFTVGDYIGLSDGQQGKQGTFGRVESIGLRSTKIRFSSLSGSSLCNWRLHPLTRGRTRQSRKYWFAIN